MLEQAIWTSDQKHGKMKVEEKMQLLMTRNTSQMALARATTRVSDSNTVNLLSSDQTRNSFNKIGMTQREFIHRVAGSMESADDEFVKSNEEINHSTLE